MKWEKGRRSDNLVDARRRGGRGLRVGGGLGLGGLVAVVGISLLLGQNPLQVLGILQGIQNQGQQSGPPAKPIGSSDDPQVRFVQSVLGETENTWDRILARQGVPYRHPKLLLFSGAIRSGCGFASSAVGPFYCPADGQVYLDLDFFKELATRYGNAGDFANAYVIAHEVGHHVQNLLGVPRLVAAARQRGAPLQGADGLSVRQELQADCYAGLWAANAQQRLRWMDPADLQQALDAASAIGDDRLQRQARGQVVPDSFTHGTSQQRVYWFRQGFEKNRMDACDTFSAAHL